MKAILVIDLPDDIFIDDCKIEFRVIENVMNMCVANGIKRLKIMPEKKNLKDLKIYRDDGFVKQGYLIGYNDCIDDIERGN